MMNNKDMYLDLNEAEIKRYIDGGYVVEEVDQMDLGGTPHNHPHDNLLVNPWAKKSMPNSNYQLRTQGMIDDFSQKSGAIMQDVANQAADFRKFVDNANYARAVKAERKRLAELMKRDPKDDSKKYSLLKPVKAPIGEESVDYFFKEEYDLMMTNLINSELQKEGLLPADIERIKQVSQDPKQFLKEYIGVYPVQNEETGMYSFYNVKDIQNKIYDHGMSARKISEDLGIGIKEDIQKDFAVTYDIWENDFKAGNKRELEKMYNSGKSREEAIQTLVNSGMGQYDNLNTLFDTSLDAIETRSETLRFSNMTETEKKEYADNLITNMEKEGYKRPSANNENLMSFEDGIVEARKNEIKQQSILSKSMEPVVTDGNVRNQASSTAVNNIIPQNMDGIGVTEFSLKDIQPKFTEGVQKDVFKDTWIKQYETELRQKNRQYANGAKINGLTWRTIPDDQIEVRANDVYESQVAKGILQPDNQEFLDIFFTPEANRRDKFGDKIDKYNVNFNDISPGIFSQVYLAREMNDRAEDTEANNAIAAAKQKIEVIKADGIDMDVVMGGKTIQQHLDEQQAIIDETELAQKNKFYNRVTIGPASGNTVSMSDLDKYGGEASFFEKLMNPTAAIQYAFDGTTMPKDYNKFVDEKEKLAQIFGSAADGKVDISQNRLNNNNVLSALDFAYAFTPVGAVHHGAQAGYNIFRDEGSLDKFRDNPSWGTGVGLGVDALITAFGGASLRGTGKKLINKFAPDVNTGSIKGIGDDLLKAQKSAVPDGWMARSMLSADNALSYVPGYKSTKNVFKEIVDMDNLDFSLPFNDVRKIAGLTKDAYKSNLGRNVITGYVVSYVPSTISDLSTNISEGNYGDAAWNVGELGLNLLPGYKFGNFGSTIKEPIKFLGRGFGQEFGKMYTAGKNLKNFTSVGNTAKDLSKTLYHGSVVAGSPWAVGAGYDLLTDKDATFSEQMENTSKIASLFPGMNLVNKYGVMGGTQFLSDPTDTSNIVQSTLEATGVGRYGKFGNTTGKLVAKGNEYFNDDEDETNVIPDIIPDIKQEKEKPLIADADQVQVENEPEEINVENEVEETEEVNEGSTESKKKKKKKNKKVKPRTGWRQKIKSYQEGGESEDMILDLDPSEIQEYILGGYIVEEI